MEQSTQIPSERKSGRWRFIAIGVAIVMLILGFYIYTVDRSSSNQPCGLNPGVSVVTVNGVAKCVVGPPIIVNYDGRIDFRNGTVVDLHANLTASSFIGGSSYDTVVTSNATRFIFNAHGVIATMYPYQGKEVFANGTIVTFAACPYPISDYRFGGGESANGTVWFTSSNGGVLRFFPSGTCTTTNG
jgi:hypothetical protein